MSKPLDTSTPPPKFEIFNHADIDDLAAIRIIEGKFKGIEYVYGVLKLSEEKNNDETYDLNFTFQLLEGAFFEDDREEFNDVLAKILYKLMTVTADGVNVNAVNAENVIDNDESIDDIDR